MATASGRTWRAAAAVAFVAPLVVAAAGTRDFYRRLQEPCPDYCSSLERPAEDFAGLLDRLGVPLTTYAVGITVLAWALLLCYASVGAVLLWFRPTGVLAVATAVNLAATGPGPFAAPVTDVVVAATLPLVLALFPTGRFWPGWLRRGWPVLCVVAVAGALTETGTVGDVTGGLVEAAGLAVTLGLIVLQVWRFVRVSDWTARQQTKWVLTGLVALAVNVGIAVVAEVQGEWGRWQPLLIAVAYPALALIAVGFALALFRYRLYDVDVVFRRTVLYGAALVGVVVAYSAVVGFAGLVMVRTSASLVGAVAVAVLAVVAGLVAAGTRDWTRRRILDRGGAPAALLEAALASIDRTRAGGAGGGDGPAYPEGSDLAQAIAVALDVRYVAVTDVTGRIVWQHGEPADDVHHEPVVDASGATLGTVAAGLPPGSVSWGRLDRRRLKEILPFVLLVLRVEREAEALRVARADAAAAREDERLRLRRDLHDGVGPLLAGQLITLDSLRLAGRADAQPSGLLAHVESQTRSAIGEIRRIARDLRPGALDVGGLAAALDSEARRFTLAGLPVTLDADPRALEVSAAAEVAVLRIVQEALANAARHAGAARCSVRVVATDGVVEVLVEDDGRGVADDATSGVGTASMRYRATELGGTLDVEPGPSGTGTRVRARIPR